MPAPSRSTRRRPYLLGDSKKEIARLERQALLWDPVAHALFDRVGVAPGWRVLEIGPGRGSLHMELRRRVGGPIDAVEPSPVFGGRLATLWSTDAFGPGQIYDTDLMRAALPDKHYDFIFARWVFLFLADPAAHVKRLVRALKPGGILAIQDYHRETVAMIPRPDAWLDMIDAERACFAARGSDVSVGGRLPAMYRAAGLDLMETVPTIKLARPGSLEWEWLSTYFLGMLDTYAKFPPFSKAKAVRMRRAWLAAARDPRSLMIAPAVLDVVGRRRR